MWLKGLGGVKSLLALGAACLTLSLFSSAGFPPAPALAAAQQPQSPPSDCPQLNSNIASTEWIGRTVRHTLSAGLTGGTLPKRELTYRWKVSPGKITSGQGTHSITVEMPECECDLSVETEVEGLEAGCQKSVGWRIGDLCFYPVSVDSYGDLVPDEEKALLDKHIPLLKKGQCWQMHITAHGKKGEDTAGVLVRAERAKQYLIEEHGVEADRITVFSGEPRDERKISLTVFHGPFARREGSRP